MEPHYRLRQRLENRIAEASDRRAGVIVVNGHRQDAPESREQQYTDALRVAAESMRYCVVTTHRPLRRRPRPPRGQGDDAAFLEDVIETEGLFVR